MNALQTVIEQLKFLYKDWLKKKKYQRLNRSYNGLMSHSPENGSATLLKDTLCENIIATIKMRNNFSYNLKMVSFLYCSLFSYRSSNFSIAKVVDLYLFASIFV